VTNAERQLELLRGLSDVTSELSQASTPDEVAAALLGSGMATLGADAGFVGRIGPDGTLEVLQLAGYATAPARFELPADAPYPLAEAVRRGEPLFIASNEQLACDFPGLSRITADDHACATVPLTAEGRIVGALNIGFSEPRPFTEDEIELIGELGRRCAQALLRAQRFADEVARRQATEATLQELRALELNDDVVQQLAVAKLALELGDAEQAADAVAQALEASKEILSRQAAGLETFRRD
jgi:GAF domain-containing protein